MPANGRWDLIRRLKVKRNCAEKRTTAVYCRSVAGIVITNPAAGMDVLVLCLFCVVKAAASTTG